jgi:asparagine synthase (glutamine-hydrolysing)
MSAIAGLWHFDGKPDAASGCARMLAAQQIYGANDSGQWSGGPLALGRNLHRLLPEDAEDRQPLHGAGGRHVMVADVRLDNREELAAALGMEAARAGLASDAAILLECLVRWGESALDRLVGDFAFAFWDSAERRLLLARDFLGQRPLHYHCGRDFFAFASMPKGIHALPDVPCAPDEQAMAEFVTLLPQGDSRSFFEGISIVEAGHVVRVTRDGVSSRRYWEPAGPEPAKALRRDHVEGLRHHLDQATRARLRGANGGVATHLSGGYDSAAVTATAARLLAPEGGRVTAFTAVPREGYDGAAPRGRIGDEGPLAAATAALYPNLDHVLIRTGRLSPLDDLDRIFFLFGRPMMNLCNWVWMRTMNAEARDRGLNVMLTGQMGNMGLSYGGQEFLPELLRAGRLVRLAREGARLVASGDTRWQGVAAQIFGPYVPGWLWRRVSKAYGRESEILEYSAIRRDRLDEMGLSRLARERGLDFSYRPRKNGFETRLWVLRRFDPGNYNKGILAGWGVDQRDPTADRRLIEYCLATPMEQFLANGETRALAKRALADRLPQAVLAERAKGLQAIDWHEGFTAGRGDAEAEVRRLADCAPAARMLDVARLGGLVEDWPDGGWERGEVRDSYRLALLRGISAGHFLRRASGTNL